MPVKSRLGAAGAVNAGCPGGKPGVVASPIAGCPGGKAGIAPGIAATDADLTRKIDVIKIAVERFAVIFAHGRALANVDAIAHFDLELGL